MDSLFRQKLLGLRSAPSPKTFAEALLGDTSWLKRSSVPKPIARAQEGFSEKTQVIESLERYALDKAQELKTDVLKLSGGEIVLRPDLAWESETFADLASLRNSLSLEPSHLDLIFQRKTPGKVQVLFVSEKFRHPDEVKSELKEGGLINELLAGFPLKTAEFFERMIGAMKLTQEEVILYPVDRMDDSDCAADVRRTAAFFKPQVIVTLGARATQRMLNSNDRLTVIHGQFFTRKMQDEGSFQVVPLFHPSIIETNANMKKTAWTDMQKIMKFLKKLP